MYNIFFTSLPPFAMGLFDQYCSAETRMKHPSLYHSSQKSEYFNLKVQCFRGGQIFCPILPYGQKFCRCLRFALRWTCPSIKSRFAFWSGSLLPFSQAKPTAFFYRTL